MFVRQSLIAAKSMKRKSFKFVRMTIREASLRLLQTLGKEYDPREARNIADWVMEHLTGQKKIDRLLRQDDELDAALEDRLSGFALALASHRPVQYVLGEAWFCGMPFFVNEYVLIPRPETEELVQWVLDDCATGAPVLILDAGTGSGCIAIALQKALPAAAVAGCDISKAALEVAERNANTLQAPVRFFPADLLDQHCWPSISKVDILVSNPPYIPRKEQSLMRQNVIQYEPWQALFVDDDDPLVFYRALAGLGRHRLTPGGRVYAETHEDLAEATADEFRKQGYDAVEIKQDMQGKNRMVRALLHP